MLIKLYFRVFNELMFGSILRKEFLFEWRSLFQLGGLISFLFSVSYLVYFFGGQLTVRIWNLLYWIIFLFITFFTASRTFEDDNNRYKIYTYQLCSPLQLFLAKSLYLFLVIFFFGFLLNVVLNTWLPREYSFSLLWFLDLAMVCLGISLLTTFTSFIASHGQVRQILMVIISLPLCFPMIGIAYSIGFDILNGEAISALESRCYALIAMDFIAIAFISFLLPLSWKN